MLGKIYRFTKIIWQIKARAILRKYSSEQIGIYLVAISHDKALSVSMQAAKVSYKILLSSKKDVVSAGLNCHRVIFNKDTLPFLSQSVDVCMLECFTKFSDTPYNLFRDIDRILIPGGKLVVSGVSLSWSVNWIYRIFGYRKYERYINDFQLIEWLSLLGFEIELHSHYFFDTKKFKPRSWIGYFMKYANYFTGLGYVIICRKKLLGGNLINNRSIFTKKIFESSVVSKCKEGDTGAN